MKITQVFALGLYASVTAALPHPLASFYPATSLVNPRYVTLTVLLKPLLATPQATYSHLARNSHGMPLAIPSFAIPTTSLRNLTRGNVVAYPGNGHPLRENAIAYSGNWCGGVQFSSSAESGTSAKNHSFNRVTGAFVVAELDIMTMESANGDYILYEWVGVDGFYWGDGCDGLIQSGTGYIVEQGQSKPSTLFVWAYFYPSPYVYGLSLSAHVNDSIKVDLVVQSNSTGTAYIKNLSTGDAISAFINGTGLGTLCGQTAEWIAENPLYPQQRFADFDAVNFSSCGTNMTDGTRGGLDGLTYIYGVDGDGSTGCQAAVKGDGVLGIKYVGKGLRSR